MRKILVLALSLIAAVPSLAEACGGFYERPVSAGVDLNTASIEQLRALPDVTQSEAEAIVKARPYASAADLITRGVLSPERYRAIAALVRIASGGA